MQTQTQNSLTSNVRVIVCVLQDVLAQEHFESYADLSEALKCRLARLKIPYRADWIGEAVEQLERGGQVQLVRRPIPESRNTLSAPSRKPSISGARRCSMMRSTLATLESRAQLRRHDHRTGHLILISSRLTARTTGHGDD